MAVIAEAQAERADLAEEGRKLKRELLLLEREEAK